MAFISVLGCTGAQRAHRGQSLDPRLARDCSRIDSLFRATSAAGAFTVSGRTTIDINQYRVRGRFSLEVSDSGNVLLEYTSSGVMGGGHEDVAFSLYDDTLRVLDRERGRFYQGEQVSELIRSGIDVDCDATALVKRVFATPPPCDEISEAQIVAGARTELSGRFRGGRFQAQFVQGRLTHAVWPGLFSNSGTGNLELTYRWKEGSALRRLQQLVLWVEARRWRVVLNAE